MRYGVIQHAKDFSTLFFLQLFNFTIICINYRAVAQADIPLAVGTDILWAFLNYALIKKVADPSKNGPWRFLGYLMGSAIGSSVGIIVSKMFLGQ